MQNLSETCAFMREGVTPRGSRFLLCRQSQSDPAFPKYPPQPVVRCDGHRPTGAHEKDAKRRTLERLRRGELALPSPWSLGVIVGLMLAALGMGLAIYLALVQWTVGGRHTRLGIERPKVHRPAFRNGGGR